MNAIDKYLEKKKEMSEIIGGAMQRHADEALSSGFDSLGAEYDKLYKAHQAAENTWTSAEDFNALAKSRTDFVGRVEELKKWLPHSSYGKDKQNELYANLDSIKKAVDDSRTTPRGNVSRGNNSLASLAESRQAYYSGYKDADDYAKWSAVEGGSLEDIQKFIDDAKAEGRGDKIDTYKMQGDDYTITRPGEGEYLRQADIDRAQKIFDGKKYTQSVDGKTLTEIYENAYANFENDHGEYSYLSDAAAGLERSAQEYESANEWLNAKKAELEQKRNALQSELDSITLHDNVNGHVFTYYSEENKQRGKKLESDISQVDHQIEAVGADIENISESSHVTEWNAEYNALPEDARFLIDYLANSQDNPFVVYDIEDASRASEMVGKEFPNINDIAEYLTDTGVVSGGSEDEIARSVQDLVKRRNKINHMTSSKEAAEKHAESAKEHPVLTSLASIPTSLVSGIAAMPEVIRGTIEGGKGYEYGVDRYSPAFAPTRYTQTVRGTVGAGIDSEAGKFLYQTTMSALDSAAAMTVGMGVGAAFGAASGASSAVTNKIISGTTNFIMSSSAGANAIYEGLEKGYSSEKAVTLGIISGVIEAASETFSIEAILNSAGNDAFWKTVAKSFAAEGSEEVVSNWGNKIVDAIANKSQAEIYQSILSYQDAGESSGQALAHAIFDSLGEDAAAFLAGGLSGAAMGSAAQLGNIAGEHIGNAIDTHRLSRSALDNDGGVRLVEAALELPEGNTARKAAEKYSDGNKNVSKHDAAVMMREVNRNLRKQISAQTESAAKQVIADELSERYGITESDKLSDMMETAYRALTGQELSPDERALYEQSEQIREIVQDMQGDPDGKFARFFTETTTDAAISATEQAMQTRETIAGVESGSTKALGSIVRPYIGKGNQKVVRGTKITAINADGTFEMSTVDNKGADAGTVTISTADLSSKVRSIYDTVIESTDNANIANAIIQAAATDRRVVAQISPELVSAVSDIARCGFSLSDSGIAMLAGVNTASWERADNTLKQAIYSATKKGNSDVGAVYSSVTREDVVQAYAASDKLGTKHAANAMLRLIERTAERYGVQVVFADLANGYKGGHIAGTNRIVLGMDIDAGLLTRTMGHEMFHYLKGLNGALSGQLQSDVITWLKDTGKYDAVYAQFEENYSEETAHLSEAKKRAYLEEEIAADSCFDALSNERFLGDFYVQTAQKKNGAEFLQKLADFFTSLSQMLRDAVANFTQRYKSNELIKALSQDADMLEHINEKFRELLASAKSAENEKSAANAQREETIRFSRMNEKSFEENVDAVLEASDAYAKQHKGDFVRVMEHTPAVILDHVEDAADLEVIIQYHSLYLETRHEGVLEGNYHNLGREIAKNLPQYISDPDTIVRMDNDRLNLFATIQDQKKNIRIVSVEMNTVLDINSKYRKYNLVLTVFPAKANYVSNIIAKHGVKVEYEKEGLAQVNPQLHKSLGIVNAKPSTDSISDSGQDVNTSGQENSGNVRYQMSADKYSYDELVSKPDMHVTQISDRNIPEPSNLARKGIVSHALENAEKVGKRREDGNISIHVNDTDSDVILSRKGLEHGLDRRFSVNAPVTLQAGKILQNAIRINEMNPKKKTATGSSIFIGMAKNTKNEPYVVRFVVNEFSGEVEDVNVLYALNAKKEPGALLPPVTKNSAPDTDSTISISDLLDFVNRYFPDILPESVLQHYGYTARPDGVLGKSVRYQKSADSAQEAEIRKLRQDYELTKLQNDLIRSKLKVWEHKVPSPKALRRYMNDVMQRYGVQYDDAGKLQAFEKLTEFYGYLVRSKTPNMVIVQDMAFDLARDMIANSAELEKTPYDSVEREFRRTLRETGVQITEAQKREIINTYGTMTNFRRESGGMIRINSNSKLFVADIIEEARSIYDIKTDHEDEFLVELLPYMKASADAARGVWVDPYNGDAQIEHMAAMDLAATLLDALYDPNIVPVRKTVTDIEAEKRYRALMQQYNYYEKRIGKLNDRVRQARAEGRQAVQNERGHRQAAIRLMAEHYAQMTEKARERRKQSETRAKIDRLMNQMNARLFRPTKEKYVPQNMQCAIIGVLEAANRFDGNRSERLAKYDRMIAVADPEQREQLARIRSVVAEGGQSIGDAISAVRQMYDAYAAGENSAQSAAYDPLVSRMLERAEQELKGANANDLSAAQLDTLWRALKATDQVVRDAVKLKGSRIKKDVYEAGRALIAETRAIKGSKNGIASSFLQSMLSPRSFFERLGGFAKNSLWVAMYDDLNDAQREMLNIRMQGTMLFNDLITGKENAEALRRMVSEKHAVDIGLTDAEGEAIKLTHDQLIALYLHMQSDDNLRHMESGGISIRTKNGKIRAVGVGQKLVEANNAIHDARARISAAEWQTGTEQWQHMSDEQKRPILDEWQAAREQLEQAEQETNRIREEHIAGLEGMREKIEAALTDYDREWISAAQEFFRYSASLIDETTYDRYGFHRDLIENYFPILTDTDYNKTELESFGSEITLDGLGFLKDRVTSYNPLVLSGVTDTVSRHLDGIAKYAGMSGALDNFKKVYNMIDSGYSDSVKNAVNDVFGNRNGGAYLEKIIKDMIGATGGDATLGKQIAGILRGGLAKSALILNPRVALLQTASYPTAAAELGWRPLARALARKDGDSLPVFSRADQELIAKYSPLLWYRLQGYTTERLDGLSGKAKVSTKIKDNTVIKKGLLGWINAMDAATVGRLWYAAQYYVDEQFGYLEHGSEEWYEQVAQAFNRTVERTQPNYTTLQRTAIARSQNEFVKSIAMFTTQRLQNFNIAYSAAARLMRYQHDFGKGCGGVTKTDLRNARTALKNSLSSLIVAGVDIAVSRVLVQALLHNLKAYRDDDDELSAQSVAVGTAMYFSESMASNVLFGSEIYRMIEACITGGKYYTTELSGIGTAFDIAGDMVQSVQNLIKGVKKTDEESADDRWEGAVKSAKKLVGDLCIAFGIPARNVGMIVGAVGGHMNSIKEIAYGTIDGKWKKYFDDDLGTLSYAQKVKQIDVREDDPEEVARKLRELYDGASDEDERNDIEEAILKYFRKKWEKEPAGRNEYFTTLHRTGLWGESFLNGKFREWEYKKDTGEKSFGESTDIYKAIRDGGDIDAAIEEYKTFIPQTGDEAEKKVHETVRKQVGKNLTDGKLDEDTALSLLTQYAGQKPSEAAKTIAGFNKSADQARIKERFMNGELDYDGAVDALRDIGDTRKDAEKCVDGWQDEWKDYFHE